MTDSEACTWGCTFGGVCTLYLFESQVRVTAGHSGLCCCVPCLLSSIKFLRWFPVAPKFFPLTKEPGTTQWTVTKSISTGTENTVTSTLLQLKRYRVKVVAWRPSVCSRHRLLNESSLIGAFHLPATVARSCWSLSTDPAEALGSFPYRHLT